MTLLDFANRLQILGKKRFRNVTAYFSDFDTTFDVIHTSALSDTVGFRLSFVRFILDPWQNSEHWRSLTKGELSNTNKRWIRVSNGNVSKRSSRHSESRIRWKRISQVNWNFLQFGFVDYFSIKQNQKFIIQLSLLSDCKTCLYIFWLKGRMYIESILWRYFYLAQNLHFLTSAKSLVTRRKKSKTASSCKYLITFAVFTMQTPYTLGNKKAQPENTWLTYQRFEYKSYWYLS